MSGPLFLQEMGSSETTNTLVRSCTMTKWTRVRSCAHVFPDHSSALAWARVFWGGWVVRA
jgi:hypothetical protein